MDVLSDVLGAVKLQGTFYFSTEFSAPWGVQVPPLGRVARFHLVVRGRVWIRVDGDAEPTCLEPGDFALIPHGASHALTDSPTTPAEQLDRVFEDAGFTGKGSLTYGGEDAGSPTRLVCGHFALDEHVEHPLFQRLPRMITLRHDDYANRSRLESLLSLIASEASDATPGSHAVLSRLSEVLFIQSLRVWAVTSGHDEGLLAALSDARLGESLQAIHEAPHSSWTLEQLASIAGMSRTVFAERFKATLRLPPMQYVALWRMQQARRMLAENDWNLDRIAEAVGYESAAAFSRVFKRWVGESPGGYRLRSRSVASA